MAARNYEDLCGTARAMDTIGERWALLVVRELLLGPKRFADLTAGLPHASQSVLSQRLKELDSAGLIRRVKLGPPVSAHVYELTETGRALEPALLALARWGAVLPTAAHATLSHDALALGLKALYTARSETGPAEIGLRLGDDVLAVSVRPDGIDVRRGPVNSPSLVVSGTSVNVWSLVTSSQRLDDALKAGSITIEGERRDAEAFFGLFTAQPG